MADRTPPESLAEEFFDCIAIIGMVGRFPGASSVEELWGNLCRGVESITHFSEAELLAAGIDEATLADPSYVKARGVLAGIEEFDAPFFGMSAREAALTDPQQRIFLECAWEALEQVGYDPELDGQRTGIFAGSILSTYLLYNLLSGDTDPGDRFRIALANDKDSLTSRVSYKLNLKGPAVTVQSACSTSLVAVHMARQSLLSYECDMALAGGISVRVPQKAGYRYQEEGIASNDGHCRAFDAAASGTVFGSGVGLVVLKRMEDALADGDRIRAVLRASALNNDGAFKGGFTAPSVDGQAKVIARALSLAEIDPETMGLMEAHGTGTALGDPIEVAALNKAYRAFTGKKHFCALGSVKTNVGHLDSAAGVTGLIKTVLALEHGTLPPSLHFHEPNPRIDFEDSPFYVNVEARPWEVESGPRRAGVSAFGVGGTNCHAIVEEAPPRAAGEASEPSEPSEPSEASEPFEPCQLLLLSARGRGPLQEVTARLAGHLEQNPGLDLGDVAFTLAVGRRPFGHRRIVVARDTAEAAAVLAGRADGWMEDGLFEGEKSVVFLFPGQGVQWAGMGQQVYAREAVFREQVDRCCTLLEERFDFDLRPLLFPPGGTEAAAERRLAETHITQPALFVVEMALARLWMSWGVEPQAMIGHSLGEYVAAHMAGVFTLEEALALVVARGRLMAATAPGAMVAVSLDEADLLPFLGPELALAAVNGPARCVVSGPVAAVAAFEERMAREGRKCRALATSHAFHSALMEPILEALRKQLAEIELRPPRIPYISNATGRWIRPEDAVDPEYWIRHLRNPVRFADGLELLVEDPGRILLEVGPGRSLSGPARRLLGAEGEQRVVNSFPARTAAESEIATLMTAWGRLWLRGVVLDRRALHTEAGRRRVALPTYPFERQRCWIEPSDASGPAAGPAVEGGLARRPDMAEWFAVPSWKRSMPPAFVGERLTERARTWLLFCDDLGLGEALAERLEDGGQRVVRVAAGGDFAADGGTFTLDPRQPEQYTALFERLAEDGLGPDIVAHLWCVTADTEAFDPLEDGAELFELMQIRGFDSLVHCMDALGASGLETPRLCVVSNRLQRITGEEVPCVARASLLGACRTLPLLVEGLDLRSIDLGPTDTAGAPFGPLAERLLAEALTADGEPFVASRGRDRFVATTEPVRLDGDWSKYGGLVAGGVYLLTDGLGPVGFELIRELARGQRPRLAFLEAVEPPPRQEWERILAAGDDPHGELAAVQDPVRKVLELEELGAEVMVLGVELDDPESVGRALARAEERFGPPRGVLHLASRDAGEAGPAGHPKAMRREVSRKIWGACLLDRLLRDHELDFFVCFAAFSPLVGLRAQLGHAAASACLDSLAQARAQRATGQTLALDWAQNLAFRDLEEGWTEFVRRLRHAGASPKEAQRVAMTPAEALEAFRRVLGGATVPQVILSTQYLGALGRLPRGVQGGGEAAPQERPDLRVAYEAPEDPVDQELCVIWEEVLGTRGIGIQDDFFDLGGDSLIALQVMIRLNEIFAVELPLEALFDNPTVSALRTALEDAMMTKLEQMSDEEARLLMGGGA